MITSVVSAAARAGIYDYCSIASSSTKKHLARPRLQVCSENEVFKPRVCFELIEVIAGVGHLVATV